MVDATARVRVCIVEVEAAGARARVGEPGPVVADGAAVEEITVGPGEDPAPEEGERYIFYQSGYIGGVDSFLQNGMTKSRVGLREEM